MAVSLIEKITRAIHGELSRIDVMKYLDIPDDTADRCAQAALTAIMDAGEGVQEVPLPCPFCGGRPVLNEGAAPYYECADCGAETVSGPADTAEEALAYWNSRADRSTAAAAERARIVAWLRKEADALAVEQANTRQGSPDWLCLREQVEDYQIIADAIERGEV